MEKEYSHRGKRDVENSPEQTAKDEYRTKVAARSRRNSLCQEA